MDKITPGEEQPYFLCFGEVLWDIFPADRRVGGAPLNVASRLCSLGAGVRMISATGADELGEGIRKHMLTLGLDTGQVQTNNLDTGVVQVALDSSGSATYSIVDPVAWDHIQYTEEMGLMATACQTLVFGSLVTRNEISRNTLMKLIERAPYTVFDVNLRPPFYNAKLLHELLLHTDFAKFNDDELIEITGEDLPKEGSLEERAGYMLAQYGLDKICVTLGAKGAFLLDEEGIYRSSGYAVDVVDTVGAGDSFLGTLLYFLDKGSRPDKAIDLACAMGAIVASKPGATPAIEKDELFAFVEANS